MAQSKKKTSSKPKKNTAKKKTNTEINPYVFTAIYFTVGILLSIFLFGSTDGVVNNVFKKLFFGLFGMPAVLVPIASFGIGIYSFKFESRAGIKALFAFVSICLLSGMFHLCTGSEVIPIVDSFNAAAVLNFSDSIGGGFFGALLSYPISSLIGRVGTFIILLILFILVLSLLFRRSLPVVFYGGLKGVFGAVKESAGNIDNKHDYDAAYERTKKATQRITQPVYEEEYEEEAEDDIFGAAKSFMEDNKNTPKKPTPKKNTRKSAEDEPEPQKVEEEFESNGIDEVFNNMPEEDDVQETEPEAVRRERNLTEKERREYSEEINENIASTEKKEYIFPTTDILNLPKQMGGDTRQQLYETSNKLISILDNFGVKAKLLQVTQGPTVTRYEIQPNSGTKISKITSLADDLALNLAVPNVLIAAVPGKPAIGVEIPNKETSSVSVRELLESDVFKKSKSKLTIALGKDIGGNVVVGNIAKMPHVLIAGTTGSGKSVCINTIITSILFKASPDEVKFIMVDPKVVELGVYNGIPHLLIPVVTDPKKAAGALNWAVSEMMRRYDLFASNYVKNLESYNQLMEKKGNEKLPQIVIIIDELADLMMVAAKEVEDYICRIAQLARAAGLHLIVATQRPTAKVITGLIKANIPSRIAFAVSSNIDSRIILDRGGAENLLGKGDMLYSPQDAREPIRVQGAFVSDDEIERLLSMLKSQNENSHYSTDLEEHIERVSTGENGVTPDTDDDGDELLPQAIELAVDLGQISTAMIQRKLKVGYSRAGRIIDQMEERGVIGPANGSKPRDVYLSHADLN